MFELKDIPGVATDVAEITYADHARMISEKCSPEAAGQMEERAAQLRMFGLKYRSEDKWIKGFILYPRERHGALPCIIWNRGGNRAFGSIGPMLIFGMLSRLALNGYAVLASQYPGVDGGEGKDEFGGSDVDDVLALKKVIDSFEQFDGERIGMAGGSRGGMMVYRSMQRVDWLRAAAVFGAPSDLGDYGDRSEMLSVYRETFGATPEGIHARSAIHHVGAFHKNTPLLVMHGTADWRVNPLQSIDLVRELQRHRHPYRLVLFEGADHGLAEVKKEMMGQMIGWFDTYVKNRSPLPDMEPHGD